MKKNVLKSIICLLGAMASVAHADYYDDMGVTLFTADDLRVELSARLGPNSCLRQLAVLKKGGYDDAFVASYDISAKPVPRPTHGRKALSAVGTVVAGAVTVPLGVVQDVVALPLAMLGLSTGDSLVGFTDQGVQMAQGAGDAILADQTPMIDTRSCAAEADRSAAEMQVLEAYVERARTWLAEATGRNLMVRISRQGTMKAKGMPRLSMPEFR
jgi:hypothetical protein